MYTETKVYQREFIYSNGSGHSQPICPMGGSQTFVTQVSFFLT
jgi:hypothetical protein